VKPIEEQGAFRREVAEPVLEGFDGGWSKRYDPFFLALTQDPHQAVPQIKIEDVEPNGLGDPEPCPIHQLQESSISILEPTLLTGMLHHCCGFLNIQKAGCLLWNSGTLKSYCRADLDKFLSEHPSVETPDSGNFSSHGRRRQGSLSTLGADSYLR
jgi:hypothetical protein